MLKYGLVWFSGVFTSTANQNWMAGRGCIELKTGPTEPGSNSVQTELNLQFSLDFLSGKEECGEVFTSVCYAGKHVGGTFQVRNACLIVVSILTPAWHWWCRHFRAAGVMGNVLVKYSWLALNCAHSYSLHPFIHACTYPYLLLWIYYLYFIYYLLHPSYTSLLL